jgi:hypothetical protein
VRGIINNPIILRLCTNSNDEIYYSSRLIKTHQGSGFIRPSSFTSPPSRVQTPKRDHRRDESCCIGTEHKSDPSGLEISYRFCPHCQGPQFFKSTPPQAVPGKEVNECRESVDWSICPGWGQELTRLHLTPKPRKAAGWWMRSTARGRINGILQKSAICNKTKVDLNRSRLPKYFGPLQTTVFASFINSHWTHDPEVRHHLPDQAAPYWEQVQYTN